eukprot:9522697-Alexandrium_andersonii.AAC.1
MGGSMWSWRVSGPGAARTSARCIGCRSILGGGPERFSRVALGSGRVALSGRRRFDGAGAGCRCG